MPGADPDDDSGARPRFVTIRVKQQSPGVWSVDSRTPAGVTSEGLSETGLTPDEVILRNYVLTMPEMEAQEDEQKDESIAGMAARLERVPEIRRAYRKAGLTPRESVTLSLALMQAMMFDQIAATNPNAKVPYNLNPVNLAFVRKNKEQLYTRMKEVQEAGKEANNERSPDEPAPDEPAPDEPTPDEP